MRRLMTALLLATLATPVFAQSPTNPAWKLAWDTGDNVQDANTFNYMLKVDQGTPFLLNSVNCNLAANPVPTKMASCTAPIPSLATGTHQLVLQVYGISGTAESQALATTPPKTPINVTVTVVIKIP